MIKLDFVRHEERYIPKTEPTLNLTPLQRAFVTSKQLLGSDGITALDAYNGGVAQDNGVEIQPSEIMGLVHSVDPEMNASAIRRLLDMENRLRGWADALLFAVERANHVMRPTPSQSNTQTPH